MSFVGAKGGAGVYQRIISWVPPHDVWIEPFAGTAAVFRHKRPARRSVLIDSDPGALDRIGEAGSRPGVELIVGDGIEYLSRCQFPANTCVYADPPYIRQARKNPDRDYYRHDWSLADHERFLDVVLGLPGSVSILISGYWSELYGRKLAGWHTDHFAAATRGGQATEWVWANYPPPDRLHDYRYLGGSFPERWRIHKRQRTWVRMLGRMPALERRAMLSAIAQSFGPDLAEYLCCSIDGLGDVAGRIDPAGDVRSHIDGLGDGRSSIDRSGGDGHPNSAGRHPVTPSPSHPVTPHPVTTLACRGRRA